MDYTFVLTLTEGLQRQRTPPPPEHVRMVASAFLIPLEYETLSRILCPRCANHDWESAERESLAPHGKLRWSYPTPGGDRHTYHCKGCGYSISVTFYFSE
jgi:hypothetical protein